MNSTSVTATPARWAIAMPSPVDTAGFVVTAKHWPAPPVASTVWRARITCSTPSGSRARTPAAWPSSTRSARGEPAFVHGGGGIADRVDEGSLDLGAGGVPAGVDDPRHRVAALAGVGEVTVGGPVELGAEPHQLAHPGRSFGDEDPDRVDVAEPDAGGDGVREVQLG